MLSSILEMESPTSSPSMMVSPSLISPAVSTLLAETSLATSSSSFSCVVTLSIERPISRPLGRSRRSCATLGELEIPVAREARR